MVEIKSEENNTVQLPNNIRQVGTPGEKIKIYIEDYVMTYLNQMTGEKPALQKAALLLGEKVKKESTDIYFISAAVAVVPMEWKEDRFKLSSDEWTALYDKINHYFKNRHILGWFLSRLGQAAAADGEIEKIHSDNFKDKGPIFYTADPLDREDAFYLYENGHLFRQHGYYIYYDRNEAMQNYMIEIRQDNQEMREGTPGFQNRLYEKKTDHHIRREAVSGKSKNRNMKWIPQAAVLVLMVGLMAWKKSETKLSGRYKTDQSTQYIYMLPEEFVFENGYCDIGSFTCTYEYKNGTLYFYWGNAVWARFKCTINGNKIVVDNNGEYITYYKQ